ncbi:PAS domain S-box protein [Candidatus Calescamantes bacterium]|nr:PAS domain S-box protein [Candidatus Calescamantes bacterium]
MGNQKNIDIRNSELIKENKELKRRLARLNRGWKVMSLSMKTLLNMEGRKKFLMGICRLLVEQGDYKMAWVGLKKPPPCMDVEPEVQFGCDTEHLSSIKITWDESESGMCPTGTAIRENRPVVQADIEKGDSYNIWREQARNCGFRSSIAIPIRYANKIFGALNIYSEATGKFHEEELSLLVALGEEIGYGLRFFETLQSRNSFEKKLKQQKDELQNILDTVPTMISYKDTEDKIVRVNRALCRNIGKTEEELIGSTPFDTFPNHGKEIFESDMKVLNTGKSQLNIIRELDTPSGKKWWKTDKVPLKNEKGDIVGMIVVSLDITDIRVSEETLRLLKTTVDQSHEGLCLVDLKGDVIYINRAFANMHGYEPEDIYGENLSIFHTKEQLPLVQKANKQIFDTGEFMGEVWHMRKDGSTFPSQMHNTLIKGKDGKPSGIIGTMSDITDEKKMQAELLKVQKLESLGILAGGIAHDFNNLLTVIFGNLQLVEMNLGRDNNSYDILQEANNAILNASNLTQQLLTFSKGGVPVKESSDITALVRESADFVLRGTKVKCQYDIPNDILHVEVDPGQINQVINNIIINSIQAMPGGGKLKIAISNIEIGLQSLYPLKDGEYVQISIKDSGHGISKEHLKSVFDPFFTTKQKGSGLGLATSFSIIRRHSGYIAVDSVPEEGTEFRIIIPIASNLSESDQIQEEFTLPIGSGKILIMDDEKPIRDLLARLLKRLGYETMMTCNGERVLEEYKKSLSAGEPFDGVILDLTIPDGMGGKETMTRLQEIDPNVKAIVSTGYTNDPAISNYKDLGFMEFLPKPYKIQDLAAKLKSIMSNDK